MSQCLMIEQMDKRTNECKKTQENARKHTETQGSKSNYKERQGNTRKSMEMQGNSSNRKETQVNKRKRR